jgi:Cu-Zn family superoxide dismutase
VCQTLLLVGMQVALGCAPDAPTGASTEAVQRILTDTAAADAPPDSFPPVTGVRAAEALVEPRGAGSARGTVRFQTVAGGTRVTARLEGLVPGAQHGFQILAGRDCDADPAVHLGADTGAPHGGPARLPGQRHAGDLGNVRGREGRGRYDRVSTDLSLVGTASPVGRAVVVRADLDDATTQPDGAAGAVIGCGIVEPSP